MSHGGEVVHERISASIIDFCLNNKTFFASDLHDAVESDTGKLAPGSAGRVLRSLRQRGKLNYRVVNRAKSMYEVL